jgi:hypothetical protein
MTTTDTTEDDNETSASINDSSVETVVSETVGQVTVAESTARHVRFEAGTNSETERSPKKKEESPTKVRMGKFNPFRDAMIVVSVLLFMALVGRDSGPEKMKKDPKDKSPFLKAFDKIKVDLAERFEAQRRVEPCDIFLAASEIPGAGSSIYAGRNFSAGDLVLEAPMLLPLNLVDDVTVFLSSYAFLLKHRPNMTNLQGELASTDKDEDLKRFELRATATIREGDELFIPFDAHVHGQSSLFEHIPTEEKYTAVRDIINGIRTSYAKAATNRGKRKEKTDTTFAVYLVKKSVSLVNSAIGVLLPQNNDKYVQMRKTYPLWAMWKGKGLPVLQANGKCLSDVKKEASTMSMVATRAFQKGDVVAPIPMYAMENAMTCAMEEEECRLPSSTSSCFGHQDSRLLLCPLTSSAFITPSSEDSNVEYQWTSKAMRELSIDKVLSSKPGDLSWDLVALRNIENGEEVRTRCCMSAIGSVMCCCFMWSNSFPLSTLF